MKDLPLDLFIPVCLGLLNKLKHAPFGYTDGVIEAQNFNNLFVGNFNRQAVDGVKNAFYNSFDYPYPIVISGSDVGVSHLLHASANEWRELNPDDKILYTTAGNFLEHMGPLVHANCWDPVVDSLSTFGLIVIDDFHQQLQKKDVQEFYSQLLPRLANEQAQCILGMTFPITSYRRMNASLRQFLTASRLLQIMETNEDDIVALKTFLDREVQQPDVSKSLKGGLLNRLIDNQLRT